MFFEINQNDVVDEILENPQVDPTAIQKFLEELPDKLLRFGVKVLIAALVFIIGMQLIKLVRRIVHSSMERHNTDVGVRQFADSFLKYALYILLIFLVASGFGINVASMVALLGSAGVTIVWLCWEVCPSAGGSVDSFIEAFPGWRLHYRKFREK